MLNLIPSKLFIVVRLLDIFSKETQNPELIAFCRHKDIHDVTRTAFYKETALQRRKIFQLLCS